MKRSALGATGWLILSLLLFACTPAATSPPVVAATPSVTVTVIATVIDSPTLPPTLPTLPTSIPATATPATDTDGLTGTLTLLLELPADASAVQLSPDQQWMTYLVVSPVARDGAQAVRFGPGAGPHPATLYLLNIATGERWQVTSDCTNFLCEFAWLSTGQFLWRDSGNLYLADPNGQNQRNLAAPEAIIEILGVTPNDTAVVRGENSLWRLYLPEENWDAVPEPLPGPAPDVEYTHHNDRLYVTDDGNTAAVVFDTPAGDVIADTTILQVPLAPGAAPVTIMRPAVLVTPGYSGMPFSLPAPLAESEYWLPAMPPFQNGSEPTVSYLLDERTGDFVPLAEFLTVPASFLSIAALSPDHRWLALSVEPDPATCPANSECPAFSTYVAPTNDLQNGRFVQGTVIGWQLTPPTLFLNAGHMGSQRWVRYSLLEYTETVMYESFSGTVADIRSSETMTVFNLLESNEGYLDAYAPDGRHLATIVTDAQYSTLLHIEGNRLYFLNYDFMDPTVTLWQWEVIP